MKLAIAATFAASAAAFAPLAPVVSRTTFLGYRIHVYNEDDGIDATFYCDEDTYLLDVAEQRGMHLPYSCRMGSCTSCAGIVEKGSVAQPDADFLDDDQMEYGFVLTCVAYPTSDCEIAVNMEEKLDFWA